MKFHLRYYFFLLIFFLVFYTSYLYNTPLSGDSYDQLNILLLTVQGNFPISDFFSHNLPNYLLPYIILFFVKTKVSLLSIKIFNILLLFFTSIYILHILNKNNKTVIKNFLIVVLLFSSPLFLFEGTPLTLIGHSYISCLYCLISIFSFYNFEQNKNYSSLYLSFFFLGLNLFARNFFIFPTICLILFYLFKYLKTNKFFKKETVFIFTSFIFSFTFSLLIFFNNPTNFINYFFDIFNYFPTLNLYDLHICKSIFTGNDFTVSFFKGFKYSNSLLLLLLICFCIYNFKQKINIIVKSSYIFLVSYIIFLILFVGDCYTNSYLGIVPPFVILTGFHYIFDLKIERYFKTFLFYVIILHFISFVVITSGRVGRVVLEYVNKADNYYINENLISSSWKKENYKLKYNDFRSLPHDDSRVIDEIVKVINYHKEQNKIKENLIVFSNYSTYYLKSQNKILIQHGYLRTFFSDYFLFNENKFFKNLYSGLSKFDQMIDQKKFDYLVLHDDYQFGKVNFLCDSDCQNIKKKLEKKIFKNYIKIHKQNNINIFYKN